MADNELNIEPGEMVYVHFGPREECDYLYGKLLWAEEDACALRMRKRIVVFSHYLFIMAERNVTEGLPE